MRSTLPGSFVARFLSGAPDERSESASLPSWSASDPLLLLVDPYSLELSPPPDPSGSGLTLWDLRLFLFFSFKVFSILQQVHQLLQADRSCPSPSSASFCALRPASIAPPEPATVTLHRPIHSSFSPRASYCLLLNPPRPPHGKESPSEG